MNTIGARLRHAIEKFPAKAMSYREFSDASEIPYRSLQNYMRDERSPNFEALQKLADMGINIHWIVTGDGEIFTQDMFSSKTIHKILLMLFREVWEKCISSKTTIFTDEERSQILNFVLDRNPFSQIEEVHALLTDPNSDLSFDDLKGGGITSVVEDITERKRHERD